MGGRRWSAQKLGPKRALTCTKIDSFAGLHGWQYLWPPGGTATMGKDRDRQKKPPEQPSSLACLEAGGRTAPRQSEEATTSSSDRILAALERIEAKVDGNGQAIKALNDKLDLLMGRVSTLESTVVTLEAKLAAVELKGEAALLEARNVSKQLMLMQKADKALLSRMKLLENQARATKLRVLGLPPGIEGSDPEKFIMQLLRDRLQEPATNEYIYVESCYRLKMRSQQSAEKGTVGATMMICVPDIRDRERLLAGVRRQREGLLYKGHKIHIFPDLVPETLRRRQRLSEAKKQFMLLGAQAGLLYPAKLRVTWGSREYLFWDCDDANALLRWMKDGSPMDTNVEVL